jgi:hypothetical protein
MKRHNRITLSFVVVMAVTGTLRAASSLTTQARVSTHAAIPANAVISVINGATLTSKEFKALPDTAVIEVQSQRYTKLQINTIAAQRKMVPPTQPKESPATKMLAGLRVTVDQAQKSGVAAANTAAQRYFEQGSNVLPR